MDNELERLKSIIRGQDEALKHWRREADRDAGIIARLKSEAATVQKHQPFEYDGVSMEFRVMDWVCSRIGPEHMDRRERAMRLIEEAIELGQSEGIDKSQVFRQVNHVFDRSSGLPYQEAGGVAVCLLAWCASIGATLNDVALAEIKRIEAKSPDQIRGSLTRKVDADLVTCLPGKS